MSNEEKQKIVKWLNEIMLEHLNEIKTYEDAATFQETQMNLMGFVCDVVPRRINELND